MKRQDFYFDLPHDLIAQYPLPNRTDSRLLTYERKTGEYGHHHFGSLVDFLNPGDVLVMNNSKVIPARLYGHKSSGGKVELFVERITGDDEFLVQIKASKPPKTGSIVRLENGWHVEILSREKNFFQCKANGNVLTLLDNIGHVPLPPYISRPDNESDRVRYQTVYAQNTGSVAAPTAGLHFDETLLKRIKDKRVHLQYVTLHVGSGTFKPVRCENIQDHEMHSEWFQIDEALCETIQQARANKQRVIAVGTTTLRCLESAIQGGKLKPCSRNTDIFITPGYQFQICDGLITNFHLPESTLLMLVSAFIGHQEAMALYRLAIEKRYRFFSYGDASLLL